MTQASSSTLAQLTGVGGNNHGSIAGMPFGTIETIDEFLHPPAASGHFAASETSYYGFNIPERKINGEIYIWFHPALKMMSASVYIWSGLKPTTLSCEFVNHHHFLPWPENGIADYCIEALNLKIRVIEPLKSVQIDFADKTRDVSFSCLQEAVMPPGVRPGGYHFTQAMKVTGWLNLYGERIAINGHFSRDRSWGKERREDPLPLPPLSWTVGIFSDDFAFHFSAHDDPAMSPEWADAFPGVKAGQNLLWGYIWKDGELVPVASVSKLTQREADGLAPKSVAIVLTDIKGRVFNIKGTVQARMPWQTWQNMNTYFCQTRWECDGHVGYGDLQDVQFNDFQRQFAR